LTNKQKLRTRMF